MKVFYVHLFFSIWYIFSFSELALQISVLYMAHQWYCNYPNLYTSMPLLWNICLRQIYVCHQYATCPLHERYQHVLFWQVHDYIPLKCPLWIQVQVYLCKRRWFNLCPHATCYDKKYSKYYCLHCFLIIFLNCPISNLAELREFQLSALLIFQFSILHCQLWIVNCL